jgi:transcriptional regulator with XRE-family HTH domain
MDKKVKLAAIEQHVVEKVKKLRLENNLRQSDIASVLSKTTSFIGNVENRNNPAKYNLKHINLLAEYFNLSPRYFVPLEPATRPKR